MEQKSNKKKELCITIINILCICASYLIYTFMLNYAIWGKINKSIAISIMITLTSLLFVAIVFLFIKYKAYKKNTISVICASVAFVFIIIVGLIPGLTRLHDDLLIDITNRIAASVYSFTIVFEIVTLIKKIITKTTK